MTSQLIKSPLPYLALLLCHLIWGANFVVAKVTLLEFPPASLAFLRFAFACLLLTPFFFAERRKKGNQDKYKINPKDLPKLVMVGLLMITLNITFFFEGITRTSAISASVLTLIIPILSVLLGWMFLKEKVYIVNLIGVITSFFGAIVILRLPQLFIGAYSPAELIGNILIILASVVWVLGSIISRQMLQKYPSLIVTSFAFMIGALSFLIPAIGEYYQNPDWASKVTMLGGLGLIYMTILSSVSAYFLFEWGLSRTSVASANFLQYIEPIIATAVAITFLNEQITIPFIVGSILIASGVYLGTLAKEHHHKIHRTHRY